MIHEKFLHLYYQNSRLSFVEIRRRRTAAHRVLSQTKNSHFSRKIGRRRLTRDNPQGISQGTDADIKQIGRRLPLELNRIPVAPLPVKQRNK